MPGHAMAWLPCRARPSRRPSGPVGDQTAAARHVGVLAGTFLVRRVPPRFVSTRKRPVTTPKVHLRDSDVLHALLVLRHGGETMVPPRFGLLGQASPANT
jgi:hypothetical protein